MTMIIRVGLSKKIGQANYGSFGASCQIDLELDPQQCRGKPLVLQAKISEAFCLCKTAIESELALERQVQSLSQQPVQNRLQPTGIVAGESRSGRQGNRQADDRDGSQGGRQGGSHEAPQPVRQATMAQVKVLQRLADQLQLDLQRQAQQHFGVPTIQALTIRQASWLIDHLKSLPVAASA